MLQGDASSSEDDASNCTSAPSWEQELDEISENHAFYLRRVLPPRSHKTIYFVRHAESMSNVYSKSISAARPWAICQLLTVGFDSALSRDGHQQLRKVRRVCQSLLPELEAVLYSPLQRTRETALALFGPEDPVAPGTIDVGLRGNPIPSVPLECLKEEKFEEYLQEPGFNLCGGPRCEKDGVTTSALFSRRIERFLAFAWNCPWLRFAIVGHSLWFRTFIGFAMPEGSQDDVRESTRLLPNASVWRVTLGPPDEDEIRGLPQMLDLKLVGQPDGMG